tara:strand:- start:246 stop:443 length:198 start_codon:yes stop_codon:yes gene_type:complete
MKNIQLSIFDQMEEKQITTTEFLESTITFLENRTTFDYMNERCTAFFNEGQLKDARAIAAEFVVK